MCWEWGKRSHHTHFRRANLLPFTGHRSQGHQTWESAVLEQRPYDCNYQSLWLRACSLRWQWDVGDDYLWYAWLCSAWSAYATTVPRCMWLLEFGSCPIYFTERCPSLLWWRQLWTFREDQASLVQFKIGRLEERFKWSQKLYLKPSDQESRPKNKRGWHHETPLDSEQQQIWNSRKQCTGTNERLEFKTQNKQPFPMNSL